jgi:hypothetical protein
MIKSQNDLQQVEDIQKSDLSDKDSMQTKTTGDHRLSIATILGIVVILSVGASQIVDGLYRTFFVIILPIIFLLIIGSWLVILNKGQPKNNPEITEQPINPANPEHIKCPECGLPKTITSPFRPLEIRCDGCGARMRLMR